MSPNPHQTITKHFGSLSDPRNGNAQLHSLPGILVIAICAIICGADTWVEVEVWGKANEQWLRTFYSCPTGFPLTIHLGASLLYWIPSRLNNAS